MTSDRLKRLFYGVVLATALVGSVTAAKHWLKVDPWVAIGPIAALELGGVVLMRHADERRQLGERALPSMLLSAGFAGGAVAINYFGHLPNKMLAYFFAGFSLAGYLIYLTLAAAARRDALRAAGKVEATAPLYGAWQWVRHPGITRRARHLALANSADRLLDPTVPVLGRGASLTAAVQQIRAEKREARISQALGGLIRDAAGPVMADIAVHTYDPDQIARRIAAAADYDGYAALLAGRLTAAKLAGEEGSGSDTNRDIMAVADAVAPTPADDILDRMVSLADGFEQRISDAVSDTVSQARRPRLATRARQDTVARPRRMGRPQPQITVILPDTKPARAAAPTAAKKATSAPARGRPSKAQKVATFAARMPEAKPAEIAKKAGVSADTVRRHLAAAQTVNGHDHGTEQ